MRGLEQFDEVPGGIGEQDPASAGAGREDRQQVTDAGVDLSHGAGEGRVTRLLGAAGRGRVGERALLPVQVNNTAVPYTDDGGGDGGAGSRRSAGCRAAPGAAI
ncbi:hypothetical protein [Nonomuraea dietziae]|uniref:hypothetical protein n=1 Tax=Nonomuraea dietziae TaxID=65515 RepID=UPI0033DC0655